MLFSRKLIVLVAAAMATASPMDTPNLNCLNGLCGALMKASAPTKGQCDDIHTTGTAVASTITDCTRILQGGATAAECVAILNTLTGILAPQVVGALTAIASPQALAAFIKYAVKSQALTDVRGFDAQTNAYLELLELKCAVCFNLLRSDLHATLTAYAIV
ncbi:hypothetical protein B0H16DRAFT_1779077 [Mycena metata]|uniref:Uncharacterized protein n=1 Tax=Mycena metata TaxID=1033252 RepID=A0AAD7JRW2_9AGAR|nr:hypothetical protein B0H16DRAFT_1779077 [Mycena metata]